MKPLNLDNRPCSPVSSNCVIWQGPTLDCINLCTGDTISDVVAKMAQELCTLLDQTNVTNYDLSCLGITACGPKDFQALIQLLIDKICELNNVNTTDPGGTRGTCPDCLIDVAACLAEEVGQPTLQLVDYVELIGNKICSLIDQIGELAVLINNLDIRVTALEDADAPIFTLPAINTGCLQDYITGSPATATIDLVLNELVNDPTIGYCALIGATGLPAQIQAAVQSQCIADSDQPLSALPTVTTFSAFYAGSWVTSGNLNTAAEAINNLWIALCDLRDYVAAGFGQSVVAAGEGITVTSVTVGTTTTYTVTNDYLESFVANLTINDVYAPGSGIIGAVLPSSTNGVQEGQVIQRYTSVASNGQLVVAGVGAFVPNASLPPISFGSFDNTTGLFTITDPGMYMIKAHIHLKPNENSTVYWSGPATYSVPPTVEELQDNFEKIGSFYIGLHPNNNNDTYVANSQTLTPSIDRNVEISTSKVITATNPTTLRVKVLNTTNRFYDGTNYPGADSISFSIVKLRSGLTTTNL
jgi:hypothetical protein